MGGPAFSRHFGSVENFEELDSSERDRFRCILGHIQFGLHGCLNHPARYISFVRDPVRRVISNYYQHQRMVAANELDGEKLTLEEYLELRPDVLDNFQSRFISGLDLNTSSPKERYKKALANIDQYYSFVGVVERFDESLLILAKMYNWPHITYEKLNTTARSDSLSRIDPSVIERIREANQYDFALYQHVSTLLDEKIRLQGDRFDTELMMFRGRQLLAIPRRLTTKLLRKIVRSILAG